MGKSLGVLARFRDAVGKKRLLAVGVCAAALLVGALWGTWIYRERQARAGKISADVTLRVLTIKGLLSPELRAQFEKSANVHLAVTETATPEDLWEKLEAPPSTENEGYDLVSLFSYQAPLAFQLSRAQPVKVARLKNWPAAAPDFRELPGSSSFHSMVPLAWGLSGIVYDSSRTAAPVSWAEALKNPQLKGAIFVPSSTIEILRLLGPTAASEKGLKSALPALLASATLSRDYLSPAIADRRPLVALVSHGETAFAPWNAPEWKFTVPAEGATLWTLSFALHSEMKNESQVYALLDFLLTIESAESIARSFHQASTNRLLEGMQIDARLKPSYLRQVPLTQINLWKDFSHARELRALLKGL